MATKTKAAPASNQSADRDPAADHAAAKYKQATGRDVGTDNARARAAAAGEPQGNGNAKSNEAAARQSPLAGTETITQNKRVISEDGMDPMTMEAVGQGSMTEEAPAVRGSTAPAPVKRVLQQGDDIMVVTRNPINGHTENKAKVLKVNQDSSIAARVDLGNGTGQDITDVRNSRTDDGQPFWYWPAE